MRKINWAYVFVFVPISALALINLALGNYGGALIDLLALTGFLLYARYVRSHSRRAKSFDAELAAELEAAPPPPRDWHLTVRGERYSNLEFTYLGLVMGPDGMTPCHHWVVLRPVDLPADVDPSEINLVGHATVGVNPDGGVGLGVLISVAWADGPS